MRSSKVKAYRQAEKTYSDSLQMELPREDYIKVQTLDISIRTQITGQGPPLFFVHGAPAAGGVWYELTTYLPNFQCILIDRPGCGLSEPVSYKHLKRNKLAHIITAVLDSVADHYGVDHMSIVASSFGAYLTMLYMLERPQRVDRLFVQGCPAMVDGSGIPAFMKVMMAPVLRSIVPRLPSSKSVFRKILKGLGHHYSVEHDILPHSFVEWYVALYNNTPTQVNEVSMITKAFIHGKTNPEFALPDKEVATIGQPVHFLWGEDDPFGTPEVGQRLTSIMPHASMSTFANSGHLPWLDRPERHAAEIGQILSVPRSN